MVNPVPTFLVLYYEHEYGIGWTVLNSYHNEQDARKYFQFSKYRNLDLMLMRVDSSSILEHHHA